VVDIEYVSQTKAFESIKEVKTQVDYYTQNGAHTDIIKLVALGNRSFGEKIQRIVMEFFNLDKPETTGHDVKQNTLGKKFEVKSSRFWVGTSDWKWQHIMEDHDYDYLLLCGVNFKKIDVFIITKQKVLELKEQGLVSQQGGGEGQGLWCDYKTISDYVKRVSTPEEIIDFINK
jgi:hypothetical protein